MRQTFSSSTRFQRHNNNFNTLLLFCLLFAIIILICGVQIVAPLSNFSSATFLLKVSGKDIYENNEGEIEKQKGMEMDGQEEDVHWLRRLVPILMGYGALIVAGAVLVRCVERKSRAARMGLKRKFKRSCGIGFEISKNENDAFFHRNCFLRFLRLFALGRPECLLRLPEQINISERLPIPSSEGDGRKDDERQKQKEGSDELEVLCRQKEGEGTKFVVGVVDRRQQRLTRHSTKFRRATSRARLFEDILHFCFYFLGIQICLVCMGFFQERIITREYTPREDNLIGGKEGKFFRDAQFLVFANRVVAFLLAGSYILARWKSLPLHVPPLYLHSFTSFSNVLSAWCQYEALKYVYFPAQTVCKASKLVPTMLMGRIVLRRQYTKREYGLAMLLVLGASTFFLSSSSHPDNRGRHSAVSGLVLMGGYLFFDAFTPNWQKKIFDQPPRLHTAQMMFAINAFSSLFCFCSLLHQGTLAETFKFLCVYENVLLDCFLLSLGSAFGQVFILMTVKRFGPVVLSLLMTIRQILSIFFSSFYFGHSISVLGFLGLGIVFAAIFVDLYAKYRTAGFGRR